MNAKARRNLQVREAYLWLIISLRRIAADQRWIFPPDALYNPNHPKALTLSDGHKEVGLSARGERILRSWNRKGLHTRWGMHKRWWAWAVTENHLYRRCYTTHANFANFEQQQRNLESATAALSERFAELERLDQGRAARGEQPLFIQGPPGSQTVHINEEALTTEQADNLENLFKAINASLGIGNYPLEDEDQNQNDAHVG